uniref:NADH dehydrogenase subunit 6 n=1 Tax=Geotomus sp. FS-2019 TaxID=2575688 RepID=A0A4D6X060_9HEMI|nr:NADH dehydrogenase subunit 6 [Geotomus sp. FS-2019]
MTLLFTMMTSLSIAFLWLNHPLSMGGILICQTIVISMISGMMLKTFLFSYIIMIIMLSGALVLFIYMASVASNEKFQTPIMLIITFIIINMFIPIVMNNMDYLEGSCNYLLVKPEILSLIKLFNSATMYITMMMIMYLLLTMIVVSNIASVTEGPLRIKS